MKYYKINIRFQNNINLYNSITKILNLNPRKIEDSNNIYNCWEYIYEESNNDPHYYFINRFLDIIEPKFSELNRLGIKKDDITFWMLYEYENQCSMEFNPQEMKRLGESEITLCIDCWEKSS